MTVVARVLQERTGRDRAVMETLPRRWYLVRGLAHASGVFVYAAGVAWLGFNSQRIFGKPGSFLVPLFVLLLFVISASVTGLLVLGKPIHLYLSGSRREAFVLLFVTLAWLVLFLAAVLVGLLVLRQ